MSRNGDYMCIKRLNRAIKSKEMASDLKISAHNFGMDFSVGPLRPLRPLSPLRPLRPLSPLGQSPLEVFGAFEAFGALG